MSAATSRAARSASCSTPSSRCSCPTATSRATVRTAARPTSTATTVKPAGPPMPPPTSGTRARWSPAPRPNCANPSTTSFVSATSAICWTRCSPTPASRHRVCAPSSANGWPASCGTGTSRATRPTSGSRSPVRRGSTCTSGWTPRSVISPRSRTMRRPTPARSRDWRSRTSRTPRDRAPPAPRCTTSSARTSSTSTACSGRPCWPAPATGCRPRCTSTVT